MPSRSYATVLVVVVSLGILLLGITNLVERAVQPLPADDGVRWQMTRYGLTADYVRPGSSAERAGVIRGDVLRAMMLTPVDGGPPEPLAVTQPWHIQYYLDEYVHVGGNVTYLVERYNPVGLSLGLWQADLRALDAQPSRFWLEVYAALVGTLYLLIGLVVFAKHEHLSQSLHFFAICALSFVYLVWNTSGTLSVFDTWILWGDRASLTLLCPTFLHFCAVFPLRSAWLERHRRLVWPMYAPACLLVILEALHLWGGRHSTWLLDLRPTLDRLTVLHFGVAFTAALVVVAVTFVQTETALLKQQMKWMVIGLTVGITPWLAFYGGPVVAGVTPTPTMEALALGPTVFIPLAFGYAIARYRLMDVDVIVRRSLTYALATFSVVMLFMLGVVKAADWMREAYPTVPPLTTTFLQVIVLSCGAILYAPFKNWLQERIDRLFYGARYDTRRGVADFGRAMATTTALPELLSAVAAKLSDTVSVTDLAIFLPDALQDDELSVPVALRPVFIGGSLESAEVPRYVGARLLHTGPRGYIVDEAGLASGGLAYYFPCLARGRLVAVIALGKTTQRTLLTSEDTELLRSLSPYIAVAIENSLLYEQERARVEELARLKEFNESIIESINVGIVVLDRHGRLTTWNSAFEKLFTVPPERASSLDGLVDPDLLRIIRQIGGDWQITEPRTIYRCRTQGRDGQLLVLNMTLLPFQSRATVDGVLICFEDVTAHVRLEEQLREADKLSSIGLLAAGVAHEVNTPLTGISSYTQMLLAECPADDPWRVILEKIRRQTLRASNIVNNLLNFSRTGNATFAPVSPAGVLDDTLQLLEMHLRGTAIEIRRRYGHNLPLIWGDAGKLQQVLMNLILNARDAMPHGGVLTIAATAQGNAVVIEVADTGVGIPPDVLHRIYDPFFTTKEVGRGTGLGLAVSYGIVQEHGGHMVVESLPGQGTTFRVKLPVAAAVTETPAAVAPAEVASASGRAMDIAHFDR